MQHVFICLFIVVSAKMALVVLFSKLASKSVVMFWPPARKMCYVITQMVEFIL